MEFSFSIDRIPAAGTQVKGELTREWVEFALGTLLRPTGQSWPIEIELKRHDKNVTVDGETTLDFEYECSRCAETASGGVVIPIRLAFAEGQEEPQDDEGGEIDVQGLDSTREIAFYQGAEVNVEDALIERIVFALPTTPLCDPDCRGLCAHCSTNLNRSSCDCRDVPTEANPWAQLANLKVGG